MKLLSRGIIAGFLIIGFCLAFTTCKAGDGKKAAKVLFITGGHDYDKENFDLMLAKLPMTYDHFEHPNAHAMLKSENIAKYDAVLLYDMPKELSDEAQRDFIAMLEKGKGLVVLHHAICSYDHWPEYVKIVGGRYHHYPWMKDGVEQPVSRYKHDVEMAVKVEDKKHPITKGVEDFLIVDEAYGGTEILPTVHPLLSTDNPHSGRLVGWTNKYKNSRVATLALGHDRVAWENPAFVKLLSQAVLWAAD